MISLKELNPKNFTLTEDEENNLVDLQARINIVRKAYGKPMFVTSGFRSKEDHKRIYMEKAKKAGQTSVRIPMGSKHLSGQAVDIADPSGELYRWCKANEAVLIDAGLYCEEDTSVPRVHFQSVPPASKKRWFLP